MLVFFSLLIIVLSLLTLPIIILTETDINVFGGKTQIKIRFFTFNVATVKVDLKHTCVGYSLFFTRKKRKRELRVSRDEKDKKSIASLLKNPIVKSVRIRKVFVSSYIGFSGATATTLFNAFLRTVLYIPLSVIASKHGAVVNVKTIPSYNNETALIKLEGIISVRIADIIYNLITSLFDKVIKNSKRKKLDLRGEKI